MKKTIDSIREHINQPVEIPSDTIFIYGDLIIPQQTKGVVLFAHGSGSSRFSPRNQFVARELNSAGYATLLIDLLTREEEALDEVTGQFRFDIRLLTARLIQATHWLKSKPETQSLPLGYFGASTGAAAALSAAAQLPELIFAVVSRGGRPDLADVWLDKVKSPTLLIVGGIDFTVIDINRDVLPKLHCRKKMVLVPDASHLFEEPGALEEVARLARDWFLQYLK